MMNFRSSDPAKKLRKLRLTVFKGLFEFTTGFANYAFPIVSMSLLIFTLLLLFSLVAACAAEMRNHVLSSETVSGDVSLPGSGCYQIEIISENLLQNPNRILLCIAMAMWFVGKQLFASLAFRLRQPDTFRKLYSQRVQVLASST